MLFYGRWIRLFQGPANDAPYKELWHACAGPLVNVPRDGERVYYFPQGHMEQLEASTHQGLDQQVPSFNLPAKILCEVVNVQLRAEQETDEVYAQITLLPEADSMIGHGLGAAGGLEAIATIKAINTGWLHPTINQNDQSNGVLSLANVKCKLLHWEGSNLVVAEGQIASRDPKAKVHHAILGLLCWKVWVNHVIVNVPLFHSTHEMYDLQDAIGSTVAWPSQFILLDEMLD